MRRDSWLFRNTPPAPPGEVVDVPTNWMKGLRAIGGILRVSSDTVSFHPNVIEMWLKATGFNEKTDTLRLTKATRLTSNVGLETSSGKIYWLRMADPSVLQRLIRPH